MEKNKNLQSLLYNEKYDEFIELYGNGEELPANEKGGLLSIAVNFKHYEISTFLLENNVSSNVIDEDNGTPVWFYAIRDEHVETIKLFIKYGVDVNIRDEHGNNAILKVINQGIINDEIVKVLIESGADPELENNHGISAQEIAEDDDYEFPK